MKLLNAAIVIALGAASGARAQAPETRTLAPGETVCFAHADEISGEIHVLKAADGVTVTTSPGRTAFAVKTSPNGAAVTAAPTTSGTVRVHRTDAGQRVVVAETAHSTAVGQGGVRTVTFGSTASATRAATAGSDGTVATTVHATRAQSGTVSVHATKAMAHATTADGVVEVKTDRAGKTCVTASRVRTSGGSW